VLTIGNNAQTEAFAAGSRQGPTYLRGHAINLVGSNSTAGASTQAGFRADGSGDITGLIDVRAKAGGINLASGSASTAFTQIGHGHGNGVSNNLITNTATIAVSFCNPGGTITMNGGGTGAYSQIGHGGTGGNYARSGNLSVTNFTGITLNSAANAGAYTQIGHGGLSGSGNIDGTVLVNGAGTVLLQSGSGAGANSYAMIGSGGGSYNGNLSNGLMFAQTTLSGKPLTKEYAAERQKWEVLYEVAQVKGVSESHPSLSPTDEFANFEIWDRGNLILQPKKPGDFKAEYIREGLKSGLKLEQQLGVNPFKYGMAGGTDAHTGITSTEEDNFFGKFKGSEPNKDRWDENALKFDGRVVKGWELGAAGWTGVWATANTREAIWDAMKRKETYASTGPRMTVRFFGGFDFTAADLGKADWVENAYGKGVPMGGDLTAGSGGKAPSFVVMAVKDPMGANLDRIQIIKGWVDAKGNKQEKVYDIVWGDADKRKPDAKGKLPAVGNTVNLKTATVENSIGDPELSTVWTDPDFNSAFPAFYYVRVLEIPTPRWTAFDAVKYGIKMSDNVTMTLQERAYTSPIWYTPKK
jgi:hypothetical protein